MLWSVDRQYGVWPFEQKVELEAAIVEARGDLFGDARSFVEVKNTVGAVSGAVPDAYLIDLTSQSVPVLYVVQIDLASRAPLHHVARQLLDVYLTTRTMPKRVLATLRQAVRGSPVAMSSCESYAVANDYTNLDQLFEELIAPEKFRAVVVVDVLEEEFERGLRGALRFPIEIVTFRRFRSTGSPQVLFDFEPFLFDLTPSLMTAAQATDFVDPADVDTLVVPAREEGLQEVFLGEQMWGPVRIPESMVPKIRFIASYQVAPVSAITHVAEVDRIEPVNGGRRYTIYFKGPPQKIGPIHATAGTPTAPIGNRYTSFARLCRAHTLEEVF